jgi:hypothetical protein
MPVWLIYSEKFTIPLNLKIYETILGRNLTEEILRKIPISILTKLDEKKVMLLKHQIYIVLKRKYEQSLRMD